MLESQGFGAGKGLELQIRTTQEDWYSYISELAVRIGSDILQIGADGLHLLNGVAMAPLEELSGYPIYTSSFERESQKTEYWYEIAIGNASNERLRIRSYNGWLHTSLTSGMYEGLGLEDSVGLMGDWATGSMLARDGTTVINDQDAFGEEWQVHENMLFAEARAPQFPQRCLPAPYLTTGRRKMPEAKMSREEAKILCANQHSDIEECIMDVMASGDPQMA